jgi:hypothetical protein
VLGQSVLDAADGVFKTVLSGPAFGTVPGLTDGVLKSVLGQSVLDAADGVFKTVLSGPAFGTVPGLTDGVLKSVLGSIDIDQMVERLSALAEEDRASAFLTRERARQLWGYYIYAMVWAVCLLVVLHVMSLNQTSSTLLGLTTTMTGLSGHAVASRARKIGLDRFDRRYPPDRKTAPSINILI